MHFNMKFMELFVTIVRQNESEYYYTISSCIQTNSFITWWNQNSVQLTVSDQFWFANKNYNLNHCTNKMKHQPIIRLWTI